MIDNDRVTCVIIARAGSRGLPGKNERTLAGRPMIAWSIDHALASAHVDRILVSTDSHIVATASSSMNVEVIERPGQLATDTASVSDVLQHAITTMNDPADTIVLLYCNVPVRPHGLIDRAIDKLRSTLVATSVQSYANAGKYHPWWMMSVDDIGRVAPYVKNSVHRRQDLPPLFIPDGGVIAVRRSTLLATAPSDPHAFLGEHRFAIVNEPGDVVDIDREADLTVAEALLQRAVPGLDRQEVQAL